MTASSDTFRRIAEGAQFAQMAFTDPEAEGAREGLRLLNSVANTAANLTDQGVDDPIGHIERVLADDSVIAKAKSDREAELLAKFGSAP
jgi:hypothetical protein